MTYVVPTCYSQKNKLYRYGSHYKRNHFLKMFEVGMSSGSVFNPVPGDPLPCMF